MSTPPTVSVLVPTFNAAAYLSQLCQSIQEQTYRNFEVLILDDGSTDETAQVLAPFRNDPRFHIYHWTPNRGVNAATAMLLARMRGEYWCNPGADDVLSPEFLAQRVERMEASRNAVLVHGPPEIIDSSGAPHEADFPELEVPVKMQGERALAVLLQHNIIGTSSVLARSDLTRLILPFFLHNWKYAQDWYLWILHAATGFDLLWDQRKLYKYRVHPQSLSLDPGRAAVRHAEIRLVPLCALNAAAQFSPLAASLWAKWRQTLYRLWLFRAARLRAKGQLQAEWLRLAACAYYDRRKHCVSLLWELCKHSPGILMAGLNERCSIQKQSFRVSGIARIHDPIFIRNRL